MNALSNDDREAQRRELLAEATAERFPNVPWREAHRQPSPPPPVRRPLIRTTETRSVIERRRRILADAMGDPTEQDWTAAA